MRGMNVKRQTGEMGREVERREGGRGREYETKKGEKRARNEGLARAGDAKCRDADGRWEGREIEVASEV